jgi:16S rRNA G1207 methylase RsmC
MNTSRSAYYQTHAFSITLGGRAIKLISKPGIPDWDSVTPAQQLLADAVKPMADARMLLLGCGPGALGAALARQAHAGSATLLDSNWIALAMAERTLNANNVTNARVCSTISVLPEQAGAFDIAMIVVPNDRKLTRRWLVEAYAALRQGGELYIAGANDHGIRSVIGDAEALWRCRGVVWQRERAGIQARQPGSPSAQGGRCEGLAGVGGRAWYCARHLACVRDAGARAYVSAAQPARRVRL